MRTIGLVDCDAFYASCERLFRPDLAGMPVIVVSSNDSCVIARSADAKKLGIGMGQPLFQVRDLVRRHRVHVFSANFGFYGDISQRVMAVLAQFSPHVEAYSIDESFLLLDGFEQRGLHDYGRQIKDRVAQWVGIPVCVGIAGAPHGGSRTLAKLANRFAKTRPEFGGVCDLGQLTAGELQALMRATPCENIWGVGRRLAARLQAIGIENALQLRDAPGRWLRDQFSVALERTALELRGVSCIPLEEEPAPSQQIVVSRSFGTPATNREELRQAVSHFASCAAEKLRRQRSVTAQLLVFAHTSLFNPSEPAYSASRIVRLAAPTSDSRSLAGAACAAIDALYKPGYRYVKAGVMLLELCAAGTLQASLWPGSSTGSSVRLMEVMDKINARMGSGALRVAAAAPDGTWQAKRNRLSPAYTTRWADIPTVRA